MTSSARLLTLLVVLSLITIAGAASHKFLPDKVVRTIDRATAVRAYELTVPDPKRAPVLGYLSGCAIVRQGPRLDDEQRKFLREAALSERAHGEMQRIQIACALPSMGFRFVSAHDSVDVTVSPSCLSRWAFSLSRGTDLDHLTEVASSFEAIRPEMLTLLREVFPDKSELDNGTAAPYRSNKPLQPPAPHEGQR